MSKQLAISAAFSVFAMSAFALLGAGEVAAVADMQAIAETATGAEANASTPAPMDGLNRLLPGFIR